jgi:glycosyltransferase involved in cell wall biosynthesis
LKWPGVFKPGDICELSGAMEYYMNRHMSEGDKSEQIRKIKENYDWEKVATATRGVYERVLNPGWVASAPSYADAELAAVGS